MRVSVHGQSGGVCAQKRKLRAHSRRAEGGSGAGGEPAPSRVEDGLNAGVVRAARKG